MDDYTIRRVQPVYKAVWPAKRPTGTVQPEKPNGKPAKNFRAAFDTFTCTSDPRR